MPKVLITALGVLYDNGAQRRFAVGAEKILSPELAAQAVTGGFAEILAGCVPVASVVSGGLQHTGGGWYQLPNGERVRGKDKAQAALDELQAD